MRWCSILLVVCVACGDEVVPEPDVPVGDNPPARFVASYVLGPMTTDRATATIPMEAGDLIVVSVASEDGTPVHDIVLGPRRLSAWMENHVNDCPHVTETWVQKIRPTSATTLELTVTMAHATSMTVYVAQFAGIDDPSLIEADFFRVRHDGLAGGPFLAADSGHLLVTTVTTCDALGAVSPPFTSLGAAAGWADMAYDIPSKTGTYGGEWSYAGYDWDANTIAFHR